MEDLKLFKIETDGYTSEDHYVVAKNMGEAEKIFNKVNFPDTVHSIELVSKNLTFQEV